MAPAVYIRLIPSQEGTSLSMGNLWIPRFITGQRVLIKPRLVRYRQIFWACFVSGNVDVCLLQCEEMSECTERRVMNLL